MRLVLLIILFFNLSSLLHAQTYDSSYSELRRPGQAVRNLGMGNTGVALSADENALYYNPAGLGNVDSLMLNLSVLFETVEISKLSDTLSNVNDGLSGDIELHLRLMPSFSFIMPFGDWFTLGFIKSVELTTDISATIYQKDDSLSDTENQLKMLTDSGFGLGIRSDDITRFGFALSPGDGKWVIGFQFNQVQRAEQPFTNVLFDNLTGNVLPNEEDVRTLEGYITRAQNGENLSLTELNFIQETTEKIQNIPIDELSTKLSDKFTCFDSSKSGNSFSLGVQRRLVSASWLRMSFGAVAHNLEQLHFDSSDNCPRDRQVEYDLGYSAQPKLGPLRFLFALDFRDFTYANVDDTYCLENKGSSGCQKKRINWGWEIGFLPIDSGASFVSLRGGMFENQPTIGFELNPFIFFRFTTIEYAKYTVSRGREVGDKPQTREVLQIRFAF